MGSEGASRRSDGWGDEPSLEGGAPAAIRQRLRHCVAGDLGVGAKGLIVKILIGISGLTLALPAGGLFGFSQLPLLVAATAFLVLGIGARLVLAPTESKSLT